MNNELTRHQQSMGRLLVLHILAIIIFPAIFPIFGNAWDILIVTTAGLALFGMIDRRYVSFLYWTTRFLVYITKEIIVSNIALAWLVVRPKPKIDPGIIGIPLTVTTPIEITVLALSIAVTPGTLVIELGRNAAGENVLFVHTIKVEDPEKFRTSITSGVERVILRISGGVSP